MLEFMKLFADMEQLFEPFTAEERGNLLTAMMTYAFHGADTEFSGNERFIWPVLRRHFDQCAAMNEKNATNGSKGGRPKNPTKPNETQKNPEKPRKSDQNPEKAIQEQEQEQEQEHMQEQGYYAHVREETTAADNGMVFGIDGSDLSAEISRNQIADGLILRYRLSRDDITREALLHDLEEYGEEKMREVLDRAVTSNTRERVSVNFWRAILSEKWRASQKDNNGVNFGQILRQREYTPAQFNAMEVNLNDLDAHGRLPGEVGYGT